MTVKVIGLDIAKNVFQVHGVNEAGEVVLRRRLRRADVGGSRVEPAIVVLRRVTRPTIGLESLWPLGMRFDLCHLSL